ncbi:mRNA-capping enzyme [Sitophilus oryzae]|uniref:mRNA-capping enzyme n=1 Tax=Sitophilus oryzae TaxID=7048 RepID=A0A6J2XMA5_SITOR|nr:mRNA-capping enzyme [Sitophilus oryzae]
MSEMRRGPGPVPNRWLHCPRKANELIMAKFMAFKTPLSADFDTQVPPDCRFHPKMFFDICKMKKIKIGLWIDLTFTSRFYNKAEIEEYGCKYVKLQCRGHGETPSKEQTHVFIELVHKFISQNPLECIGVHCTHGFNRTGFLITSYLIEKMDCSLDLALQMFAKARPVGIYKQDYIMELYKRYGDVEDMPPAPDLPNWCSESDDTNSTDHSNGNYEPLASTSSHSSASENVPFLPGVKGVYHFDEQPKKTQIQKKVQLMCGWKNKGFPGSQPVSMDSENLALLHQMPYRVSWKADGTRYMMLIDGEDQVYLFDRDFRVFKVKNLRFLHRKNLNTHLRNTLLEGEMVIDKVDGKDIPRYLAYDIIKFEDQDVGKYPFYPTRLQILESDIIKPRYIAMEQLIINKTLEPFSVRKKDFWPISQAASLLGEKFAKSLSHEPDGLIFQPSDEPYVAGRCDNVLKWKPLDLNSIDFRLRIVTEGGTGIVSKKVGHLYLGQYDQRIAKMDYTKALKDLDGKIIECKLENNKWKFMRERTDKTFPNSYNTAMGVMKSIQTPVTKEILLNFIEQHGFKDDSELMPHPSKRIRS